MKYFLRNDSDWWGMNVRMNFLVDNLPSPHQLCFLTKKMNFSEDSPLITCIKQKRNWFRKGQEEKRKIFHLHMSFHLQYILHYKYRCRFQVLCQHMWQIHCSRPEEFHISWFLYSKNNGNTTTKYKTSETPTWRWRWRSHEDEYQIYMSCPLCWRLF